MNGKIAHEYFVERREWTSFDSIPENAIHAVMATEDRAFYSHWGMNVWAIPSAVMESYDRCSAWRHRPVRSEPCTGVRYPCRAG